MKIIISINGLDGSGKSTQIELLKNKNPYLIDVFGGLENYFPFNQDKRDFDWWFLNSKIEEFIDIIYKAISERNKKIQGSNKPIILLDKGLINFDIRVISTLLIKSLSEEKSNLLIKEKKRELKNEDIEDFKIFFTNPSPNSKNKNIAFNKTYENYQINQKELMEKYLAKLDNNIAIKFNCKGDIEYVSNNLNNLIFNLLKTKISLPLSKNIFGIGGLSESGKSSLGFYFSKMYNIWNLKINYFNNVICNRYQIKPEELMINDKRYISILEAEEISNFLNINYYIKAISIESLHNYLISLYFKDIFKEIYQIIFIDTNIEKRIYRNSLSLKKDILYSELMVKNKDLVKFSRDADQIIDISDFIIYNNSSKIHFYEQIDHIINKLNIQKNIMTKEINEFNMPQIYKDVLEKVYKEILKNTNLKLFILHGSCSNGTVIENFSDIDLIIVIEPNDKSTRKKINEIITQSLEIKIGTTIYNSKEFENLFVDLKTIYALYTINKLENFPIYISDISIPKIEINMLIKKCKILVPEKIHELRRILYNNDSFIKYDEIFKKLSHIMKNFLILEEIESKGYFESYKLFSEVYQIKEFNVNKYFADKSYKKEIIDYANYVLDNLNIAIESKKVKRKASRGIILKDDNIILIHRIKQDNDYYVYPGGGVEMGETKEQCVLREIKEELGINVEIIKYLYRLESSKDIEYYFLCKYLDGEIGTGKGPEFTDKNYLDRGKYIPELHPIKSIDQINLKKIVSSSIIQDMERYNSLKEAPFKNLI